MLVRSVLNFNTLGIKTSTKRSAQHFPPTQLWKIRQTGKGSTWVPSHFTEGAGGRRGPEGGSESTSYIRFQTSPRIRTQKTLDNLDSTHRWSNNAKLKLISWHVNRGSIVPCNEAIKGQGHRTHMLRGHLAATVQGVRTRSVVSATWCPK